MRWFWLQTRPPLARKVWPLIQPASLLARKATALAMEANPTIIGIAGWQGNPPFHFYGGVALVQAADSADPETRERYLDKARALGEKVAFWASHAPDNMRHRHLLLAAELARVRGDRREALDLYDEGIRAAVEGGYLHDGALGNELCARCYLALGRTTSARAGEAPVASSSSVHVPRSSSSIVIRAAIASPSC